MGKAERANAKSLYNKKKNPDAYQAQIEADRQQAEDNQKKLAPVPEVYDLSIPNIFQLIKRFLCKSLKK